MKRERLEKILSGFNDVRVAVFGDYYVDKWLYIDRSLDEPSLETQLTAYQVVEKNVRPGAAGTIVNNLYSLGAKEINAVGVIGDDGEGYELTSLLRKMRVDDSRLISCDYWTTPAYIKPTFRTGNEMQESNRLDIHNRKFLEEREEKLLIQNLYDISEKADALIVSDQRSSRNSFGVITPGIIEALSDIAAQNPKLCVYADSRAAIDTYRNLIVKCNHLEALRAVFGEGDHEKSADLEMLSYCAESLREKTGRDVIITCGENGSAVLSGDDFSLIPAVKVSGEIDVTGAGDSMTAGLISAYCAGADLFEAAFIGNLTASVTIQQIGRTGVATRQDVLEAFKDF